MNTLDTFRTNYNNIINILPSQVKLAMMAIYLFHNNIIMIIISSIFELTLQCP